MQAAPEILPAMKNPKLFRILYVARSKDDFLLLSAVLNLPNVKITFAETVSEALQKARFQNFDLYLLETRLPDGDGFELCKIMRDRNPSAPIFFYSGDAGENYKQKGFSAGANEYYVKPYLENLMTALNQFAAGNQQKSHF
jgi:CheY-like chemotaxis protein